LVEVLVAVFVAVRVAVFVEVFVGVDAHCWMTSEAELFVPPNCPTLFKALLVQLTVTATLKCGFVVMFIFVAQSDISPPERLT
jgi:hypothetical protein